MKKTVMAIFIMIFALSLMAGNYQLLKQQPQVFKTSQSREETVVYQQDFENDLGTWTTHDGTLPSAWWHLDNYMTPDGTGMSWWMGDTAINGYIDHIYVVLDTDEITVSNGDHLTFDMNLWCEGLGVSAPYDGWDGADIRVSTDGGTTWDVIAGYPAYNSSSMYSFGFEHGEGPGVPGWGGSSNSTADTDHLEGATEDGWISADFDMSAYAGQNVKVRFAFASDPAYNTADDPDMFGFMVDNISLGDFGNDGVEDGLTPGSMVPVSGDFWHVAEQPDAPSPTHAAICQNDEGSYDPLLLDYLISEPIMLPEGADVIRADFMVKGGFTDPDEFPEVDYWGWEISPDNGVSWSAMSNPYFDPNGTNYVYSDAPEIWSAMLESYSLDGLITDYHGQEVMFRWFFQTDADTPEGIGIMIDDFKVYAEVYVGPAPENLTASTLDDGTVELNWEEPGSGGGEEGWINYDDGVNNDGIGTGAEANFSVAARFTSESLINGQITKVKFFPKEASATYTIKLWTGANAANEVYSQAVPSPEIEAWNEIDLDTPVDVDPAQELWVGYNIDTPTGYPAGVDAGPAVAGYGDMIYWQGAWDTISNMGLDYNWNIQAYLIGVTGQTVVMDRNQRDITGYNIYHTLTSGEGYELIDTIEPATTYNHTTPDDGVMNYYMVTAIYDGNDESGSSNEAGAFVPPAGVPEFFYDDGTAEEPFNVGSPNQILVKFTPEYTQNTIVITHFKFWIEEAGTGQVVVRIYGEGSEGMPATTPIFTTVLSGADLSPGWNYIAIDPEVQFTGSDFFAGVLEMQGSPAFGLDTNNQGETYVSSGVNWGIEDSGNVMFRVYAHYTNGNTEEIVSTKKLSASNYPNPFNPETTIKMYIPTDGNATLKIYNTKGQVVKTLLNGEITAGSKNFTWQGKDDSGNAVSSGLYFYKLQKDNKTITNKMLLLK